MKHCCRCNTSGELSHVARKKAIYFCETCSGTDPCFSCKLPAGNHHLYLDDGIRIVCKNCKPIALDISKKKIIHSIRKNIETIMERTFKIVLNRDIFVKLLDREQMNAIISSKHIQGIFRVEKGVKWVNVISGLLPGDVVAVMSHELVHAWQYCNHIGKDWDDMALEGFPEYVAHHITTQLHFASARDAIKTNYYEEYRKGFEAFKALEQRVGISGVMHRVNSGRPIIAETGIK